METHNMNRKSLENEGESAAKKVKYHNNFSQANFSEASSSVSTASNVKNAVKGHLENIGGLEEQQFQTTLSDLNEDCCMELFKYLNLLDLAELSEVNRMFKRCAEKSFETVHKSTLNFTDCEFGISGRYNFKRVLKKFGASTVSLKLDVEHLNRKRTDMYFMNLIANTCGSNMRALALKNFKINLEECDNSETKLNICRLMSKLQKLQIIGGYLYNCYQLFDLCGATIESIILINMDMDSTTKFGFLRNYPNLRTLIFPSNDKMKSRSWEDGLVNLLRLNPTIRKLKLSYVTLTNNLIDAVSTLPELNNLNVLNLNLVAPIGKLQKLKLRTSEMAFLNSLLITLPAIETLTSLEIYSIGLVLNDSILSEFSRIPNLSILKIRTFMETSSENFITERFDKLLELHAEYDVKIEGKKLLPHIIKMMPNLRFLHFRMPCTKYAGINPELLQEISNLRSNQSPLTLFLANENFFKNNHQLVQYGNITAIIGSLDEKLDTTILLREFLCSDYEYDDDEDEDGDESTTYNKRLQNFLKRQKSM